MGAITLQLAINFDILVLGTCWLIGTYFLAVTLYVAAFKLINPKMCMYRLDMAIWLSKLR